MQFVIERDSFDGERPRFVGPWSNANRAASWARLHMPSGEHWDVRRVVSRTWDDFQQIEVAPA